MNENESMNTSTEETQVNTEDIVENKGENTNDVTVDRDFVPDDQDVIPPTPTFSDGSDATEEGNNNSINIPFVKDFERGIAIEMRGYNFFFQTTTNTLTIQE